MANETVAVLIDAQNYLLNELGVPGVTRDDVAMTYALAIRSEQHGEVMDWGVVNRAIMARWSRAGLDYIKKAALKRLGERFEEASAAGPVCIDGLTPKWLAALRERPQSARDLAVTLGQPTNRRNLAAIRQELEVMERRGEVQRSRTGTEPWIWEAADSEGVKHGN